MLGSVARMPDESRHAKTNPSPPSPPPRARCGRHRARVRRVAGVADRGALRAEAEAARSDLPAVPAPPTAAPSTRAWRSTFRRRIPTPARTCWSCRRTAARWCCSCCWRAASKPAPKPIHRRQPAAACAWRSRANSPQRAFLNDKIDLAQAEAIADLIDASTEAAARSASRSLSGEFSREVHALRDALIHLRMLVEATLDFPGRGDRLPAESRCARPARAAAADAGTRACSGRARARCCAKASRW